MNTALLQSRHDWDIKRDDSIAQESSYSRLPACDSGVNVIVLEQFRDVIRPDIDRHRGLRLSCSCDMTEMWLALKEKWESYGVTYLEFQFKDCDLVHDFENANIVLSHDVLDAIIKQPASALSLTDVTYQGPQLLTDTKQNGYELEQEFNKLAATWYNETGRLSSANQIVLHPAYQQIIGMGKDALPFIFKELKRTRGHWIWALAMILRDDKAKPGMKYREAVDAWLTWGANNGYI